VHADDLPMHFSIPYSLPVFLANVCFPFVFRRSAASEVSALLLYLKFLLPLDTENVKIIINIIIINI